MTGSGHGRRHITTAPVDDFDCHFLFADTHCVNRLGVATPMFAIFSKWHLSAAAHAGPPMLSRLLRLIRRTGAFLMIDNAAGKPGGHSR